MYNGPVEDSAMPARKSFRLEGWIKSRCASILPAPRPAGKHAISELNGNERKTIDT